MKTRVIRTAITEIDEEEAYDLVKALEGFTGDSNTPLPTEKQTAVARLFAAQLSESLG